MAYGHLVGLLHKQGTFKDKETGDQVAYNKIECIILVRPKVGGRYEPVDAIGNDIATVKNNKPVSFDPRDIDSVFGRDYRTLQDLEAFIDEDIEYFCDEKQRISKIVLLNEG